MTCTVTDVSTASMPNTYKAVFTLGYQYWGADRFGTQRHTLSRSRPVGISVIDERYPHFRHMKIHSRSRSGLTLVELSVTTGLVGVLGLIIYSLLNMGTILGAKNTAVNTAHQQARVAMLQMTQDLHAAISLPYLFDVDSSGNVILDANGVSPCSHNRAGRRTSSRNCLPAMVRRGPHKDLFRRDHSGAAGQKVIHKFVAAGQPDA